MATDSYDQAQRQVPPEKAGADREAKFSDPRGILTEEQVHTEASRCLSCGRSVVDPHKCIGCGLCTTRCEFDAIHLIRDHPKNSTMRRAEDKVGGLLGYAVPRAFKILLNSGSKEAKLMREKRREFKKQVAERPEKLPHTGNAVDVDELMQD